MSSHRLLAFWMVMVLSLVFGDAAVGNQGKAQLWTLGESAPESRRVSSAAIEAIGIEIDVTAFFDESAVLQLPLTLGRAVEASFTGIERRSSRDFTWRGRVDDGGQGRAVFTLHNGIVHGQIYTRVGVFFVGPTRDGGYQLAEIDQARLGTCGGTLVARAPVATPPPNAAPEAADPPSEIDLMVLYTENAWLAAGGEGHMEAAVRFAVDMTNTAFADSQMDARFRLVHTGPTSRTESGGMDDDLVGLATDAEIAALRDVHAADLVALIIEIDRGAGYSGICGLAYFMDQPGPGFANSAFSVSDRECALAYQVLAHETGHNLGLQHDPDYGPPPNENSYPWSYGHFVDELFYTVMSYKSCSGACIRVPNFSNPGVSLSGLPTGITDQRDNHRSGNLTAPIAANFRSAPACRVTVSTPNGGENLLRGTNNWLFWETSGQGCGSELALELMQGGAVVDVLANASSNDAAFEWVIPEDQAIGDNFKLRVSTTTTPPYSDESDEAFGIHEPTSWPSGRWVSHGPEGGSVEVLAIDPTSTNVVYAGITSGGIYKSTDGGASWVRKNVGLTETQIRSIAIDPQDSSKVYVATFGGGVFRSTNAGGLWVAANTGVDDLYLKTVVVDPQAPTTLYASSWGKVFKSTNGGLSWTSASTGLPYNWILSLAVDPTNSSVVYAGSGKWGLYRSMDGGSSWEALQDEFWTELEQVNILDILIDPTDSSVLYLGGSRYEADYQSEHQRAVYKSIDGGETWTEDVGDFSREVRAMAMDPSSTSTLYNSDIAFLGVYGIVWKSADGAETWDWANEGLDHIIKWACTPDYVGVLSLAIDPETPSKILAGTAGAGVFVSDDAGETWEKSNSGLRAAPVFKISVDPWQPQVLFAGMEQWGGGLFKSSDSSTTWKNEALWNASVRTGALAFDLSTPGIVYAGLQPYLSSGVKFESSIYASTNGVGTWSDFGKNLLSFDDNVSKPGPLVQDLAVGSQDPNRVFANMDFGYTWIPDGLYRTDDAGLSWSFLTDGMCSYTPHLAVDPQDSENVYIGCPYGQDAGKIYRSQDAGDNWQFVGDVPSITTLTVDPTDPETVYAGSFYHLFKSTNGGSAWFESDAGITTDRTGYMYTRDIVVNPFNASIVCAGTSPQGVVCSRNGGASWFALDNGLISKDVRTLAFDPTDPKVLFAGSMGGGVYRWEGEFLPAGTLFIDDFESADTSAWSSTVQ